MYANEIGKPLYYRLCKDGTSGIHGVRDNIEKAEIPLSRHLHRQREKIEDCGTHYILFLKRGSAELENKIMRHEEYEDVFTFARRAIFNHTVLNAEEGCKIVIFLGLYQKALARTGEGPIKRYRHLRFKDRPFGSGTV